MCGRGAARSGEVIGQRGFTRKVTALLQLLLWRCAAWFHVICCCLSFSSTAVGSSVAAQRVRGCSRLGCAFRGAFDGARLMPLTTNIVFTTACAQPTSVQPWLTRVLAKAHRFIWAWTFYS